MRPLLALLAPLALLAGSGCVVTPPHGHITDLSNRAKSTQYRFSGPPPDAAPAAGASRSTTTSTTTRPRRSTTRTRTDVYRYSGPDGGLVLGLPPDSLGRLLQLPRPPPPRLLPAPVCGWSYSWDRGRDVYVYSNPRYTHGASPVNGGYQQPAPSYPALERRYSIPSSSFGPGWLGQPALEPRRRHLQPASSEQQRPVAGVPAPSGQAAGAALRATAAATISELPAAPEQRRR